MKSWLKEPLLHFSVAGVLLFAAYDWINRGETENSPYALHLTVAEVDWLRETWTSQWQRAPTDDELRGLVSDYLKESLLAREAMAMGLDENDIIVRRRLAQKMAFLVEGTALLAEPSEQQLRDLYDTHQALFQSPGRVTFSQLFFSDEQIAQRALEELVKNPDADVGDPSLLPRTFLAEHRQAVAGLLGEEMAEEIFSMATGSWQGPLASGYGFHLVRIEERVDSATLPFDQAEPRVAEEWHRRTQSRVAQEFYASLLEKYRLSVEHSIKPLVDPILADLQ
jgi:hypothetical protein